MTPLRNTGFARGLVARLDGRGTVYGLFFGPRVSQSDDVNIHTILQQKDVILQCRFGDLGFLRNEWKIVAHINDWSRAQWKLPAFLHVDSDGRTAFERYYNDKLEFVSERRVDCTEARKAKLPEDGLYGYGAVEIVLTRLLSPDASC